MKIKNIQESKEGLKRKKLFDIVKSHGGFAEKTPSFYLNDITDNDVIGIVDGSVLDFLKKSYLDKRIQWAQKQGYVVNKGDNVEVIPLKDFTWVAIIERGVNLGNKEYLQTKIGNLKNNRYKNTLNRGDRQYQWSDTGKWGSPRAEEFFVRRNQNDIANQRRQRYGNDSVYRLSEHILSGLDEIPKTIRDNENNNKINENNNMKIKLTESKLKQIVMESVKKVLNESYGYDAYSQSGFEECRKIGERCAHNAMKELISTYDEYNLDNECISKTINAFESKLWSLADVGYEDEGGYKKRDWY